EPIVMARKPLIGTVAKNVLEHGTGAINIDATRIAADGGRPHRVSERRDDLGTDYTSNSYAGRMNDSLQPGSRAVGETTQGRWPANTLLSHDEGCVQVGTKRVRPANGSGRASRSNTQTTHFGSKSVPVDDLTHLDADGT